MARGHWLTYNCYVSCISRSSLGIGFHTTLRPGQCTGEVVAVPGCAQVYPGHGHSKRRALPRCTRMGISGVPTPCIPHHGSRDTLITGLGIPSSRVTGLSVRVSVYRSLVLGVLVYGPRCTGLWSSMYRSLVLGVSVSGSSVYRSPGPRCTGLPDSLYGCTGLSLWMYRTQFMDVPDLLGFTGFTGQILGFTGIPSQIPGFTGIPSQIPGFLTVFLAKYRVF